MRCSSGEGQSLTEEGEHRLLEQLEEAGGTSKQALWDLALLYSRTNRRDQALESLGRLAALAEDREERASCCLAMGQVAEQTRNFEAAVGFYREARALNPETVEARYLIHNNLGYSLIQLGRSEEAEPLLEAAIAIDPSRPNAFKNLGLAMQSQGRIAEAADYFVLATEANVADGRAFRHLEALIADHPGVLLATPGLAEQAAFLRPAVENAAQQQAGSGARRRRPRGRSGKRP
jgi:tetratricopeptide (TPR) repeat protein